MTEHAPFNKNCQRCTAKSKRSGERCKNVVVKGKTVCRMHGGKSLSGWAHPNYQHGNRSKNWIVKLVKHSQEHPFDTRIITRSGWKALDKLRDAMLENL